MLLYGSDESLNSTPESVLTSWNLNKNRKKKERVDMYAWDKSSSHCSAHCPVV